MKLSVPNVLSLSRFPLGLAVAIACANHAWGWASGLYLAGCASDFLDGYVAKKWNAGSDFGANVLEPVCDLALTVGALSGLLWAHQISLTIIIALAVVAATVQIINSFFTRTKAFTHFGMWFMPCIFLGITWVLTLFFARLALGGLAFTAFVSMMIAVTIGLVWYKRHRFADWFQNVI